MKRKLPKEFLEKMRSVKAKRAKIVIDHILKHGHVTTEELKEIYGYDHPPRAARDVRELGIPLDTVPVQGKNSRKIAAYRFGNPAQIRRQTHAGRKAFPKAFKNSHRRQTRRHRVTQVRESGDSRPNKEREAEKRSVTPWNGIGMDIGDRPLGPPVGAARVTRGGSWILEAAERTRDE